MKYYLNLMLALLFILSGCVARVEQFNDPAGFEANKKSIVIIQNKHIVGGGENHDMISHWKKLGTNKVFVADPSNTIAKIVTLGVIGSYANFGCQAYYIEPGSYSLSNLYLDYFYANDIHNMLEFTAHGGEVVYIGELQLDHKSSRVISAIDIKDNFLEAQQYFKENYPLINKSPIKRLAKFSPTAKKIKALYEEFGEANE